MKKPGRPPLEPRVSDLEQRVAHLESQLQRMSQEHFTEVKPVPAAYIPAFDRWPSNGST